MVGIERSLFGVLRERRIFNAEQKLLTSREIRPRFNELVSLVSCQHPVELGPNCIVSRPMTTACVDLRPSIDEVFKHMNATNRNMVRQGQKLDADLEIVRNEDRARRDFLALSASLQEHKGIRRAAKFERTMNTYRQIADVWTIYLRGLPYCSHMVLPDLQCRRAVLAYSASRRFEGDEERKLCGVLNRYLTWKELEHYKREGHEWYDFGGLDDPHDAPNTASRFKLSFGSRVQDEYRYVIAGAPRLVSLLLRGWEKVSGHRVP